MMAVASTATITVLVKRCVFCGEAAEDGKCPEGGAHVWHEFEETFTETAREAA